MTEKHSAIKLDRLQKTYAATAKQLATTALHGISLDIAQGEIFALLGPNGAGKSTIINILVGLVRKTGGSASVLGFDVEDDYRDVRKRLGVVSQEVAFDPFFTVHQALETQAGLFGVPRSDRWTDELLTRLSLDKFASATPRTLSGGMKRRLLVAKALVHRPPVLILDEPTAGVDVELRRSLWEFVREMNRDRGTTILLTTHHMEEAESLAQRIGIIAGGELKALDTLDGLKQRYGKDTLENIYLGIV